jgi:hypothetical protein
MHGLQKQYTVYLDNERTGPDRGKVSPYTASNKSTDLTITTGTWQAPIAVGWMGGPSFHVQSRAPAEHRALLLVPP